MLPDADKLLYSKSQKTKMRCTPKTGTKNRAPESRVGKKMQCIIFHQIPVYITHWVVQIIDQREVIYRLFIKICCIIRIIIHSAPFVKFLTSFSDRNTFCFSHFDFSHKNNHLSTDMSCCFRCRRHITCKVVTVVFLINPSGICS